LLIKPSSKPQLPQHDDYRQAPSFSNNNNSYINVNQSSKESFGVHTNQPADSTMNLSMLGQYLKESEVPTSAELTHKELRFPSNKELQLF